MDAGGKDGTIQHVMGAMNPQGCLVQAFKTPSAEEAAHDFLWRVHKALGGKGTVTVFNRSHYEDVLVVRVHKLVPKEVWSGRYDHINDFEKELTDSGTHILKFFLHISKEEQLFRFKERLNDPTKQWKISESDYLEREFWDDYMKAYEDVLRECSTDAAPWFVIPSNHKWFRNLAVSQILVEHLEALKMEFPKPTVDLKQIGRRYHRAEKDAHRHR
jgi:PPK2 family polyphosphate:nucleotide phosphotransferase